MRVARRDTLADVAAALTMADTTQALVAHFPYRGDSHDWDRFVDCRPADRGRWLLYGHVHERWLQRGRMINVGVDAWSYRPVSEEELSRLLVSGPR